MNAVNSPRHSQEPRRRTAAKRVAIHLGVWTALALLFAGQSTLYDLRDGQPLEWRTALLSALHFWYLWALLAPLVVALGRRAPFRARKWPRALGVHLPSAVVVAVVQVGLRALTEPLLWGSRADSFGTLFVEQFHLNLLVYAGVLGVSHAFAFHRESIERAREVSQLAVEAAQVEARLARAELDQLVMQLQPHFLFNTLQAISTLMHEDVRAADRVLAQLGALLRRVLDLRGVHETALRDELDLLASYVDIQKARFQERLSISVSAAPPALDALVPPLLLQPLVENAIAHGVAPRLRGGRIVVHAAVRDGTLTLQVRDDGPGLDHPPPEGIGLATTRARLAHMYGAAHRLELRRAPEGGLEVLLALPYRLAGAPA